MDITNGKISKVLVTEAEIKEMIGRLGSEITADYQDREIVVICVLKGAIIFMADLIRAIDRPLKIDFMAVSSYGDSLKSTGVVKIIKDCDIDISGKHVIVVEDIIDTGLTLKKLVELLKTRNPASIEVCTAFNKASQRQVEVDVKYIGMEVPNEFIIGYGLDFEGEFRNVPEVVVFKGLEG